MIRKITALAATATLVAGALVGASAPAHAAANNIYKQCTDINDRKLTPRILESTDFINCRNIADVSPLSAAKNLRWLNLLGDDKTLKITGMSKLKDLGITTLHMGIGVSDPTFAFVKDFPRLTALSTGTTTVSSLENIATLENLGRLSMATSKPHDLSSLASNEKLTSLALDVGRSTVDMESIAALSSLQRLTLFSDNAPSLEPLRKSTSLAVVEVQTEKLAKLKKGQTYKIPAEMRNRYGAFTARAAIGWNPGTKNVRSVASNGTGMAALSAGKESKLGQFWVTNTISLILHTPGKIDFTKPTVSKKTARKGQTVRAAAARDKQSRSWNPVISKCTYQWQRNTKNIKGATKLTYKAARADVGKILRLKTTCHPVAEVKDSFGFSANTKYSGAVKVRK